MPDSLSTEFRLVNPTPAGAGPGPFGHLVAGDRQIDVAGHMLALQAEEWALHVLAGRSWGAMLGVLRSRSLRGTASSDESVFLAAPLSWRTNIADIGPAAAHYDPSLETLGGWGPETPSHLRARGTLIGKRARRAAIRRFLPGSVLAHAGSDARAFRLPMRWGFDNTWTIDTLGLHRTGLRRATAGPQESWSPVGTARYAHGSSRPAGSRENTSHLPPVFGASAKYLPTKRTDGFGVVWHTADTVDTGNDEQAQLSISQLARHNIHEAGRNRAAEPRAPTTLRQEQPARLLSSYSDPCFGGSPFASTFELVTDGGVADYPYNIAPTPMMVRQQPATVLGIVDENPASDDLAKGIGTTFSDARPACSSVMLTDHHLLTAAHCTQDNFGNHFLGLFACTRGNARPPAECQFVVSPFGTDVLEDNEITVKPSYPDTIFSVSDSTTDHDLAVIRLALDITETDEVMCLSAKSDSALLALPTLRTVGFPSVDASCKETELPKSECTVDGFGGSQPRSAIGGTVHAVLPYRMETRDMAFISGASGSPVFHCNDCSEGEAAWVVGVLSAFVPKSAAHDYGLLVKTPAHRTWIDLQLEGEMGVSGCWVDR